MAVKKQQVTDIFVYKWRYFFGYIVLVLLYIGAVVTSALYAPGGLTQSEIDAIRTTNDLSLSIDGLAVANLPFHALQLVFFKLFGVSLLTIKAPAILLSIISSIAIFFLLKRWFKPSVAILSMLIMITTAQFLFIGQSATPAILYVFYAALILLFATLTLQKAKITWLWRILLAITAAASLLTPYFWYINLGLLFVALLHPHPRYYLISRKYRRRWLIPFLVFCLATGAVAYLCLKSGTLRSSLLGFGALNFNIASNLKVLFYSYLRIEPSVVDGQITPIMDFSALILIFLGLAKSFQKRASARSSMIWSWLFLALILIIFDPQLTATIIVPLFILLAVGIETLMNEWYKLFPKNPYARGTGLVFISALIIVMVLGGSFRYVDGYQHYPLAAREFNSDLSLLKKKLSADKEAALLVSEAELPIYKALIKHSAKNLYIVDSIPSGMHQPLYISRAARQNAPKASLKNLYLSSILVNSWSENGDRFYLYTSSEK